MKSENDISNHLTEYYLQKLLEHGPTPKGVDWASLQAQQISFEQLIKLFSNEKGYQKNFSLLDFGCGYGAFYDYLIQQKIKCNYTGFDVLDSMLNHARDLHINQNANWINNLSQNNLFDYVVASGIFTLKLNSPVAQWEEYVLNTIKKINSISKKGFAFNSLTSYSDAHLMKDYLYYPDPCFLFDFCKKNFSNHVSLLHDYPKYEFTIIVRKLGN